MWEDTTCSAPVPHFHTTVNTPPTDPRGPKIRIGAREQAVDTREVTVVNISYQVMLSVKAHVVKYYSAIRIIIIMSNNYFLIILQH